MYAVQMNSVGSLLASHGVWWFDGSQMLASTKRYDHYHMEDTEDNREQTVRFYRAVIGASYRLWRLLKCKPLLQLLPGIRKHFEEYHVRPAPARPTEVWTEEQMEEAYAEEERRRRQRKEQRSVKTEAEQICEERVGQRPDDAVVETMPIHDAPEDDETVPLREDEAGTKEAESII